LGVFGKFNSYVTQHLKGGCEDAATFSKSEEIMRDPNPAANCNILENSMEALRVMVNPGTEFITLMEVKEACK
jgi:hypothetical protein